MTTVSTFGSVRKRFVQALNAGTAPDSGSDRTISCVAGSAPPPAVAAATTNLTECRLLEEVKGEL